MGDRGSLEAVANWIEQKPRRANLFFACVTVLVHVGALLLWIDIGDHTDLERATVLTVWGLGLLCVARLVAAPVPDSERASWLLLDGILTTALVLAMQNVGNPLVFQRAMIPIAIAFMVADRRPLGWWMSGWFAGMTVLAAVTLPALGYWQDQNTWLWVFWAAIPLVLCSGPFMLIANGKAEYAERRALGDNRDRARWLAKAAGQREVEEQARLRALVELHSREAGWLEDVTDTLAEQSRAVADADVHRRLAEIRAVSEATMGDSRRLLDELGGNHG